MLSNTTADTAVLKVEAVDKDLLLNGTVSYTIKKTDGSHYNLFTIDQSGTIRTRKSLKNGKLNYLLYFPFDGRSTSITCPVGLENKVLRLAADQNDPEAVRLFAVGSDNGFLQLIGTLDREKTARYDLRIRAKDAGIPSLWSMGRLQIAVQNVRDDPPLFSSPQYNFNVAENLPPGTLVGGVVASSQDDAVNEDITYSIISGDPLAFFTIEPRTGKIRLIRSLDFESQA